MDMNKALWELAIKQIENLNKVVELQQKQIETIASEVDKLNRRLHYGD